MAYKVLKAFTDLSNNHIYNEGDIYPFQGEVDEKRVQELASVNNKRGQVLIESEIEVEEDDKQAQTSEKQKTNGRKKAADQNAENNS
ncbi:hypothetical protein JH67_03010 [Listeria monocytogenes]|nr:hypothetical protein [Listeria monocytogenes]